MDYKEVWEVLKWIVASIIGLAVLYLGIKSFKKDSHGAIYKKMDESNSDIHKRIDELQKQKANKEYVDREIDKISKQNSELVNNHIVESTAQFSIILEYMKSVDSRIVSVDGTVKDLNQNLIAVLQQNSKKK